MAGIVLAGGHSSRMRQDKAELNWGGKSLLSRQVSLLEDIICSKDIYISGHRPKYNSIADIDANQGPVEGLRSVLTYIKKKRYSSVLVLPVDMPLISREDLLYLVKNICVSEAIHYKGFGLPAAFNDTENLLKEILDLKNEAHVKSSTKYSFKNLFDRLNIFELNIESNINFINTNTPEEWNEALSKAEAPSANW